MIFELDVESFRKQASDVSYLESLEPDEVTPLIIQIVIFECIFLFIGTGAVFWFFMAGCCSFLLVRSVWKFNRLKILRADLSERKILIDALSIGPELSSRLHVDHPYYGLNRNAISAFQSKILQMDEDNFYWSESQGESIPSFLLNDVFVWACSDAENIFPNDIPDIEKAQKDCAALYKYGKSRGILLWACRKRQWRPQVAYYKYLPKELHPLFDAAGREEDQYGKGWTWNGQLAISSSTGIDGSA